MKLSRLFLIILSGGFLVLPLVYWPEAEVVYEIPRVWFIQRWIEVLMFIGVISFCLRPGKEKLNGKLVALVTGFLGVAVVSSWLGVSWLKSFWGNYYRGDGLVTLVHLVSFWLILALLGQGIRKRQ